METRKNKGKGGPKSMTMSQAMGVLEYGIKWGCGRQKVNQPSPVLLKVIQHLGINIGFIRMGRHLVMASDIT